LYERSSDQPGSNETSPGDRTDNTINSENAPSHPSSSTDQLASSENNDGDLSEKQLNSTSNRNSTSFSSPAKKQKIQANTHQALTTNPSSVNHDAISNKDEIRTIHPAEISHTTTGSTSIPVEINPFISNSSTNEPAGVATDHFNAAISNNELNDAAMEGFEADHVIHDFSATDLIATSISPVDWNDHLYLPKPKYVKKKVGTYTEFGIVSQMDYNRMRMPEDKLYSAGRQVVFPQKGLLSTSLGSGFTIALGHPRWAIETGLIYSSKKFNPGRQLVVGSAFDRGSVEFKTMNLQLVSLPLQFRYRIDHKGSFRFYSLAGFEIHLITKSDIDVLIKYDFASAAAGVDPNNDPKFANVIQETRRISEHIRDGAPLSTKSFLSLNAGLGCEYSLSGQKTLFLQSAVQYQVPNVKFSNNNGKNIRSISIQGGVRMPIGK
ncbi:MAG: hypothetical protein ABIQ11_12410, partial [Saprospiraceae bacterium]